MLSINPEVIGSYGVGDVFTHNGSRYKILKKTRTAVAVERYYFFDAWFDAFHDWAMKH